MSAAIPSWARVGAKVVCVDAVAGVGQWGGDAPREGAVYTIRATWLHDGDPVCDFTELRRCDFARRMYGPNVGYFIGRFRPVVEDKSDDEIECQIYHKKGLHQRASRKSRADA